MSRGSVQNYGLKDACNDISLKIQRVSKFYYWIGMSTRDEGIEHK